MLFHNGYLYNKDKARGSSYYWECRNRKHKVDGDKCSARATTLLINGQHIIKNLPQHNHGPSVAKALRAELASVIRSAAKTTSDKPSKIIQDAKSSIPVADHPYLQTNEQLRQSIKKARKNTVLKEPETLDSLQFPEEILQRVDGTGSVLVKDIRSGNHRVCIFSSPANVNALVSSPYIIGDGTFKTSPSLFKQLYSLHGIVGGSENSRHVPLVYALLTGKSQEIYSLFFDALIEYCDELQITLAPKFFISDFEMAILNVTAALFPTMANKTCLFHFGQIIWRKVQSLGLARRYGIDRPFALFVKKLIALAFLSPQKIMEYYPLLTNVAPDGAEELCKFLDKNYVRGEVRKTLKNGTVLRATPRYHPNLWSVAENNQHNLPRTSNAVESWHRRWENLINVAHPGLFKFVDEIKKEIHNTEGTVVDVLAGRPRIAQKRELVEREIRISNILNNKEVYTTKQYVEALAVNMET